MQLRSLSGDVPFMWVPAMKSIFCVLATVGLAGCAGEIVTYQSSAEACTEGVCKGVPFHQLVAQDIYYYQDRILDKEGKVTHFAGAAGENNCLPMRIRELKLVPSRELSFIHYDARTFESSKFTTEFDSNGLLTKAGSESTPGPKVAAESIGAIATSVQVLRGANVMGRAADSDSWVKPENVLMSGIPVCNAGMIPIDPPSDSSGDQAANCGGTNRPCQE